MASKYGAKKTYGYGQQFDSKKEATRYTALLLLQRAGKIQGLRRQVKYELIPTQTAETGEKLNKCSYVADFVYYQDGREIVEDVKPANLEAYKKTAAWREYMIKKKLMLQVYGILVKEV